MWTDLFVLWVLLFSAVAYALPAPFRALSPAIVPALGVIMFGMGMTLQPADFARVARMKLAVACGLTAQFLVMPLTAWAIATIFRLPPELAMGFIIVGSCPGGTASNVICYLAKADVALSVTMTALSTLMAIVLTPWLIGVLGGRFLPVNSWDLFMSVVKIVLVPVLAGFGLRRLLREQTLNRFINVFPAVSVLLISLVIASIVASSRERILDALGTVGILVALHNVTGLTLGYAFASALRLPVSARRAIAIEVGMQNSGLGVALAKAHFSNILVALPSSVFSVVHNLSGSALAGYWRRSGRDKEGEHERRRAD
ncbi:MAG: bile acid:sodium symporter family protein [Candidatus Hydrogenedentes bacterium]|nr:bile acid:sodium symporter family protein [Candidatus Hydrogenedentota bacterium]